MTDRTERLDDDQLAALHDYACRAGRTWKASLLADWEKAGPASGFRGDWPALQRIRNGLGPGWLDGVTFARLEDAVAVRLAPAPAPKS